MKSLVRFAVLAAAAQAVLTSPSARAQAVFTTTSLSGNWDGIPWKTNNVSTTAIPGGNPMDVVDLPYQNPATGPYSLNGSRSVASVGSVGNGGWTLQQTNPGDTLTLNSPFYGASGSLKSAAINKNNVGITLKVPIIITTNVFMHATDSNGSLTLTKGWTDNGKGYSVTKGGNGILAYSDDVSIGKAPVFGDLNILMGWMSWKPNVTALPASLNSFGDGTMLLNGGGFELNLNNSSAGTVTYSAVPVVVGPGSGSFVMQGNTAGHTLVINGFDVGLGGLLMLGCNNSAQPGTTTYNGSFTIIRTNAAVTGLITVFGGSSSPNLGASPIQDGPSAFFTRQPLVLKAIDRAPLPLAGTNTYDEGTVIDSIITQNGTGYASVSAASSLGTGDVFVRPAGRLRLGAAANVAAGKCVTLANNATQLGYCGLAFNGLAAISADSSGILGVDTASFSQTLDLSDIGDGTLLLGSSAGGTYGAATLGAGQGNRYRLGGGGSTLTFTQAGVISAGASGLDIGSVLSGGNGTVKFNAAQSHALPVTVARNSTLQGVAQAVGTSPFGTGPITLQGGNLHLINNGTSMFSTNSAITFTSAGLLQFSVADWQVSSMLFGTLTRNTTYRGTLTLSASSLGTGTGRNEGRVVIVGTPPATAAVNGGTGTMVAPYYIRDDRNFLTYGAYGFKAATYSATADLNAVNNANAEVFTTTKDQTGASIVVNPTTVHALKVGHAIGGAALTISSGGLIVNGDKAVANAINFGAEGVVYAYSSLTANGALTATDGLTKFGPQRLTLSATNTAGLVGPITINQGTLQVGRDNSLGAAANEIILNGGTLFVDRQGADPLFTSARTLRTGPAGGTFSSTANDGAYSWSGSMIIDGPLTVGIGQNNSITITGPIQDAVGAAGLLIIAGSAPHFIQTPAASVTYSGGTLIFQPRSPANSGPKTHVYSGSRLGTGDVVVEQGVLVLEDDAAIAPSARLWTGMSAMIGGNILNSLYSETDFMTAAPVIGSLEGLGTIRLGNATTPAVHTALTLGGDDTDSAFFGTITQASGRTGSITKAGAGVFTLGGASTYTGATTVNAGTLRLVGSLAGGVTVGGNGTLSGKGRIGGNLAVNGTWEVQLQADGDHEQMVVNGAATFANGAKVEVAANGTDLEYDVPVVILTAAGGISGQPSVTPGFSLSRTATTLSLRRPYAATIIVVR